MVTETTIPRRLGLGGVVNLRVLETTKGIRWFGE